ncbi:MAG: hypothetical protein QM779_04850 [Propionicimonas sp.]|uniref:hypothetical protein n=1 Tax=Propionicimonas sp. TaxID=1955623 RepID=UPI003D0A3A96
MPIGQEVAIRVTVKDGKRVPGYAGLAHCGSVWSCPVCSARICEERARMVNEVCRRWVERGGRVVMVSLTVRHHRGMPLAAVWDAVGACWNAASSGPGWARDSGLYGAVTRGVTVKGQCQRKGCAAQGTKRVTVLDSPTELLCEVHAAGRVHGASFGQQLEPGDVVVRRAPNGGKLDVQRKGWMPYLRVFDVTVGHNGWHPHVHALVFVDGSMTDDGAYALGRRMWERWNAEAQRQGLKPGIGTKVRSDDGEYREPGFDSHVVKGDPSDSSVGRYFAKAVYELVGGAYKTARNGSRTPFGLLAAIMRHKAGVACIAPADHSPDCECGQLSRDDLNHTRKLWAEWEETSSGRHQLGISHGLLDFLDLDPKTWMRDDEEIAQEELGTVQDTVAYRLSGSDRCRASGGLPLRVAVSWLSRGCLEGTGWPVPGTDASGAAVRTTTGGGWRRSWRPA